jgi:hypothetical protein
MILPGDALKARLDKLSIYTAGGCGCRSLAKEMNELGLDRCRRDRDRLAAQVKQTAAAMGYLHQSLDHFAGIIDEALADATASLGPPVPINSLAVVACYFNPCHYATPLANFRRFADGIRSAGLPLHAIELAFDDDEFETDAEFKLRGSSQRHKLWQKERLLNIVMRAVGAQYDALAWIDADVIFTRRQWAEDAKRLLSHYPVIQLFRTAHDLHPDKRMTKHRPSMASVWPAAKARDPNATHPGFAWAGRSDWLLKYGLEDQMVIGGGDCTTMRALQADAGRALPFDRDMSPQWKAAYRQWAAPLAEEISGRIGFVDQSIVHLWHGTAKDRHYVDRWAYVADYDPATDTCTDETGLIAWTDFAIEKKPDMVRQVAEYFSLRKEDGPKAALASPPRSLLVPQPPALDLQPNSKRAVVTVAVGEKARSLLRVTGPYMQAYADRLGADFVVLDQPCHPDWPMSGKFAIGRTLDHYERIAYVDVDVLLRPGCIDLFEQCGPDEFGAVNELGFMRSIPAATHLIEDYQIYRVQMGFARLPEVEQYINAGIMIVPRAYKDLLLPPTRPTRTLHCDEQHHTNARIQDSGLPPIKLLDRRANWQLWTDKDFRAAPDDAILHFSGQVVDRLPLIKRWSELFPLPGGFTPPEHLFPEPHQYDADLRHVRMIHDELCQGSYGRVLEIGCFRGYSTSAFLAALKAAHIGELHLCELAVTPELERVIAHYAVGGSRLHLHQCTSLELLQRDSNWDAVFVDGDHSVETCTAEAKLLIAGGVRTIMAHDSSADPAKYPACEGPAATKTMYEDAGYILSEDTEDRPGERTDRGLMIARLPAQPPEAGLRLSIIVATKGRPASRTLESITSQMRHGDELIIQRDETGDMGATPRTRGMLQASGDWLLFMDDDDVYLPNAFDLIRAALRRDPARPHLFGLQSGAGWQLPQCGHVVKLQNVSTQMIVTPNQKEKLGQWGRRRCGDFDFIASTISRYPAGPVWHDEPIAVWRP